MKLVIFSDTHFNNNTPYGEMGNDGVNLRLRDYQNAVKCVVRRAVEWGADRIIHLGDVFNSPRPSVIERKAFFESLVDLEMPIDILVGNHDRIGKLHAFSDVEDLEVMFNIIAPHKKPLTNLNIYSQPRIAPVNQSWMNAHIHYLPWMKGTQSLEWSLKEMEKLRGKDSYPHILFSHFLTEDTWGEIPADLLNPFDVVLLGDYHKLKRIIPHSQLKYYLGSLYKTNFGEACNKNFFALLEVFDDGSIDLQFEEVQDRRWIQIASSEKKLSDFIGEAYEKDLVKDSIIKVILKDTKARLALLDMKDIKTSLQKVGAFSVKIEVELTEKEKTVKRSETITKGQRPQDVVSLYAKEFKGDKKTGLSFLKKAIGNE
jgi:DNA repair exonuclease SbcCD nuclease subunit